MISTFTSSSTTIADDSGTQIAAIRKQIDVCEKQLASLQNMSSSFLGTDTSISSVKIESLTQEIAMLRTKISQLNNSDNVRAAIQSSPDEKTSNSMAKQAAKTKASMNLSISSVGATIDVVA